MPSGVYERTPEHLAVIARNRGKKKKRKANGAVRATSPAVPVPRRRVAADVVGFSTKQLIEATRRGDFSVAREWLVVGEVFRELSRGRTPSEEFIKLADNT